MRRALLALATLALTACGVAASVPEVGRLIGKFSLGNGGGIAEVRILEVGGTKCIVVGRYSALAMSCDWSKP